MSITYLVGDATVPKEKPAIIAHVCNDLGIWGAGFVIAVSNKWPKAKTAYLEWKAENPETRLDLGFVQFVDVENDIMIANMIGQYGVGVSSDGRMPFRPDACLQALTTVFKLAKGSHSVHMPRIGCGLAGATWLEVEPIIYAALEQHPVDVYVYDLT